MERKNDPKKRKNENDNEKTKKLEKYEYALQYTNAFILFMVQQLQK